MATYARRLNSELTFSVYRISGNGSTDAPISKVAVVQENAAALGDNDHYDIFFTPDPTSAGALYMVKISSQDATVDNCATVWTTDGPGRITGHVTSFLGRAANGRIGAVGDVGYSPPSPYVSMPERIVYSPVTQCNLNCVHCISSSTRSAPRRLQDTVRKEIMNNCHEGKIRAIYTDYSGDILWADERWGGEIDFLIDCNVPFHIDTNGVYLTEDRGRKLLSSKIDWLNVSLDAATPETYKRIRKGSAPLAQVVENVAAFVRLRNAINGSKRPLVSLGFTAMRSNIAELPQLIGTASEIGVDLIACRHLEAYTDDMIEESLWSAKDLFNEARQEALAVGKALGVHLEIPAAFDDRLGGPGHRFCYEPWLASVILGNGDVQACCVPETKVGSLNENTLEEIWSGAKYAAFRQRVNSSDPPAQCNACPYTRKPGNMHSYLPALSRKEWVAPYNWTP